MSRLEFRDLASTFDAHARAHIPNYTGGHDLIVALSDFFARDAAIVDLGCGTGELLHRLADRHGDRCRVVGVDSAHEMITLARRRVGAELHVADVRSFPLPRADMVIAYHTLGFIPIDDRPPLLTTIYQALRRGGAFVWFEKTRAESAAGADIIGQLYSDFKLSQGVSPDAVLAKAQSLRGVLEPLTVAENTEMLRRAGFPTVTTLTHSLGFHGVYAVKE